MHPHCPPLPRRLNVRTESGFTLIELMVVFIVLAVLAAVAVPSYLGTRDRANVAAAKSAVRSSVPAIEAYRTENDTYVGVSPAALTAAYGANYSAVLIPAATAVSYCVEATVGPLTYSITGPDGAAVDRAC
jgi:type IV pilus assembly protein PilA